MPRIKLKQVDQIWRKSVSDAQTSFIRHCQLKNLAPYTVKYYKENLQFFLDSIVFLYFLQKKGWLGVSAWPRELNAADYKSDFFRRGSKSRELIPVVYTKVDENTYRINASALSQLSDEDETFLSTCVKGEPWGSCLPCLSMKICNLFYAVISERDQGCRGHGSSEGRIEFGFPSFFGGPMFFFCTDSADSCFVRLLISKDK